MKELFNIGDILTLYPQLDSTRLYSSRSHVLRKCKLLINSIDTSTSIKLNCTCIDSNTDSNENFIINIVPGEYYKYALIGIYKLPDIEYPYISMYKSGIDEDDIIKINELELNYDELRNYMIEKLVEK